MNKLYNKNVFIIIDIFLIIVLLIILYIFINNFLTNDIISPTKLTFYEYFRVKLSNII